MCIRLRQAKTVCPVGDKLPAGAPDSRVHWSESVDLMNYSLIKHVLCYMSLQLVYVVVVTDPTDAGLLPFVLTP